MAAKKKAAPKAEKASEPQPGATQTKRALSEDVAPIEQAPKTAEKNPSNDSVVTPSVDPTLSADNQHSSYSPSSHEFPSDQGNQMEETPGKPS